MLIICSSPVTPVDLRTSLGEQQKTTGIFVRTQSPFQTQDFLIFLQSTWSQQHDLSMPVYQGTSPPSKVLLSLAISVIPVCLQSSSTPIFQLLHHFQSSNKVTTSVLYLYSETGTNSWSSALIYKRYLHRYLFFSLPIIYI